MQRQRRRLIIPINPVQDPLTQRIISNNIAALCSPKDEAITRFTNIKQERGGEGRAVVDQKEENKKKDEKKFCATDNASRSEVKTYEKKGR
jgi:hypothetical protein